MNIVNYILAPITHHAKLKRCSSVCVCAGFHAVGGKPRDFTTCIDSLVPRPI